MKKKLFSIVLTLLLLIGMTSAETFATVQQNEIQNLEQLKSALSGNMTMAEQTRIIEKTDDAVLNQFIMEKLDAATELLDDLENNVNMQTLPDGTSYGIQECDLGDGCTLTVEFKSFCLSNLLDRSSCIIFFIGVGE